MEQVIIIGGGPAGYTAAIYTARALLNPLVVAGYQHGGQLMLTTEVENFPGFPAGILGPELMENMRKQAERFGARLILKDVTEVNLEHPPYRVRIGSTWYEAPTMIIATGARPRFLEIPGEKQFMGRGVSTCATCDGAFYKDQVVAVVGGGDSAMEEALFLTRFASKLYLIHRRDQFRASAILQKRVQSNLKIEILWNTVVHEVHGDERGVTGITIENTKTGESSQRDLQGLFIAIGHIPNTDLFRGQIDLDRVGYIKVDEHLQTNKAGVFAAGDVVDFTYRQAITAAGMGCQAAIEVERYLSSLASTER